MRTPLSPRALLALAAIVVPAAIVAVIGYVSLRQWERSAELLFREQARDIAAMAADKVEMVLKRAEDELLARLQRVLEAGEPLDTVADSGALAGTLDLFDRDARRLYPRAGDAPPDLVAAILRETPLGDVQP